MPSDPPSDIFFDVDHPHEGEDFQNRISFEQHPWTLEWFQEVSERILADHGGGPPHEFHDPKCPKLLTNGEKACRCGARPLEAIFEDANAADALPVVPIITNDAAAAEFRRYIDHVSETHADMIALSGLPGGGRWLPPRS